MRRKHRSAEERERIVAAFRESGLSQEAFAKKRGINVGTLRSWIYRPKKKSKPKATQEAEPMRFVEVQAAPGIGGRSVLIRVGASVEVELDELPAPEYLVALARATC